MDPVSQGVVGAVAATCLAKKKSVLRFAVLAGWAGGMLADADIFIRSADDPLLNIQYHRHFSHSLFFIPIGGLICAGLLFLIARKWQTFRTCLLFATAGYATSGLLDACTSYGTHLLWPLNNERVAWNIISIVDPVFTLTLIGLVVTSLIRRQARWGYGAAIFGMLYLSFGAVQNFRATKVQEQLMEKRGHATGDMATVKPSIGNVILWRSIYRYDGKFYVDAIRVTMPGSALIYDGESVPVLNAGELKRTLPADSILSGDIDRFAKFSNDYLAHHPDQPDVVGDLRYAAVPNDVVPLWGIRYDPAEVDRHVRFDSFREVGEDKRENLIRMLRGRRP